VTDGDHLGQDRSSRAERIADLVAGAVEGDAGVVAIPRDDPVTSTWYQGAPVAVPGTAGIPVGLVAVVLK